MQNYLGVKFFIKEPHPYEFEDMEGIDMLDYDYFFKIRPVDSWRGNGYAEADIYTNGENKVIEVGDWKIVPIAKMPFNWTGYSVELKAFDKDEQLFTFKASPDSRSLFKKSSYFAEVIWLVKTIHNLHEIECAYHANVLAVLNKITQSAKYHQKSDYGIGMSSLVEMYEDLKPIFEAIAGDKLNDDSKTKLKEGVKEIEWMISGKKIWMI